MSTKKTTTDGAKKATAGKKAAEKAPANAEPKVEVVDGAVEGVLLAAVKPELVDGWLEKAKLPTTGELPERVARLVRYFREVTPPADLGDCNTCKGDSNVDETVCPVCPYCGVGGVVDAPKGAAPPATATAASTKPEASAAKPEAAPATAKQAEPEAAAPAASAKASPAAVGKAAKAPAKPLVETKKSGEKAALAESGKTFTVADLDAALADVETAKKGEVGCYWDLGHAIHRIFANKLYLQRRATKGDKPLYETWGAFCEEELGMTGGNAYRVMDVATSFDRATAILIGVKKLNAALRVEAPEKRAKLLEGAEKISVAEFEAKVAKVVEKEQEGKTADRGRLSPAQKARNEKGSKATVAKGDAGKASNVAKPPAVDPKEKITAALALGKVSVKLFAKGAKITDPEAKRAKRLADGPFGVEETVNGVTSKYTISTDAKGALVLHIERKRA